MSVKAQTHFNTICNVQVISTHWLPPPRCLACLCPRTALQMRPQHCPPISVLTTPYAFTPPPLPSLRLCSALPTCLRHSLPSLCLRSALSTFCQHFLPSLCSHSALPTCSQHHLSLCLCSALLTCLQHCLPSLPLRGALPTLLTILTLLYYIHSVWWLVGVHDERNCQNILSGLLCQQDLRGNWSVYSQCCG
ncbi:hypothetical protein O181_009303 [Austropuccinia psidii MF-1]|uniref:Uncharacterized protein n=1 Tax=Austropuccinia psidii MF-1 TaxID=1389203 RepID=A0A9Q3BR43_9BASI|nr:hypothetical protein [Austropuccinia psidii MF-1]